jgi:hypothetical protein
MVLVKQNRGRARRWSGSQRNLSCRANWIIARAAQPFLPGDLPTAAINEPCDERARSRDAPMTMNLDLIVRSAADDDLFAGRPAEAPEGDVLERYVAEPATACRGEALLNCRQPIAAGNQHNCNGTAAHGRKLDHSRWAGRIISR